MEDLQFLKAHTRRQVKITVPGPFTMAQQFFDEHYGDNEALAMDLADAVRSDPRANTTIAVVATNAKLDKASAKRLAVMAQDGLARSIRPVHTPQDGDTVFAIATGRHDVGTDPLALGELGTLAADCLARAVARGVYNAASLGAARGWRDVFGR